MKRGGGYLGGSTVVRTGSDWFSKIADPSMDDHKATFDEIVEEYISEEIVPNLEKTPINTNRSSLGLGNARTAENAVTSSELIGFNSKTQEPKLYVPAEEGRQFVKKRANSPFKKPKRKPVVEYKSKLD